MSTSYVYCLNFMNFRKHSQIFTILRVRESEMRGKDRIINPRGKVEKTSLKI